MYEHLEDVTAGVSIDRMDSLEHRPIVWVQNTMINGGVSLCIHSGFFEHLVKPDIVRLWVCFEVTTDWPR
jgi:hypothetical protein